MKPVSKSVGVKRSIAVVTSFLACVCCAKRLPMSSFQVLPATPTYRLRSPDSRETPFGEILREYNGFEPGLAWMDLRPEMELRIEDAYYQPGMPRSGLNGFLGTEVARYTVRSHAGLELLSVQLMADRPKEQLSVQKLIPASQQRRRYFRFYYEVFFRKTGSSRGSVLLSANAKHEIKRLASALARNPDSVCRAGSKNCTVFPEACSVSIEMQIVVNGVARNVIWRSTLSNVVDHPHHVELLRFYKGRLTPVNLDARDEKALDLPLLPGDHVVWS